MSSREKFEAWWEINYHNGKPPRFGWAAWRDGDGYKIDDDESELDGMWNAWQAATNAMEAKCAALAAEVESVKSAHQDAVNTIMYTANRTGVLYTEKVIQMSCKTPATDAFLAEVRAQHSESICVSLLEKAGEYEARAKEVDCHTTDNRYRFAAAMFRGFAAQLRQDANTAELVAAGIITRIEG